MNHLQNLKNIANEAARKTKKDLLNPHPANGIDTASHVFEKLDYAFETHRFFITVLDRLRDEIGK